MFAGQFAEVGPILNLIVEVLYFFLGRFFRFGISPAHFDEDHACPGFVFGTKLVLILLVIGTDLFLADLDARLDFLVYHLLHQQVDFEFLSILLDCDALVFKFMLEYGV